jgi:hypothetical protein
MYKEQPLDIWTFLLANFSEFVPAPGITVFLYQRFRFFLQSAALQMIVVNFKACTEGMEFKIIKTICYYNRHTPSTFWSSEVQLIPVNVTALPLAGPAQRFSTIAAITIAN